MSMRRFSPTPEACLSLLTQLLRSKHFYPFTKDALFVNRNFQNALSAFVSLPLHASHLKLVYL